MKNNLQILLIPDSFKGSMRATEVCRYLRQGMQQEDYLQHIKELPMADGGEGTVEAMVEATGGQYKVVSVHNPLMTPVNATYGLIHNGKIAVIEMAAASGLELINESEKNPLLTSTYGTGELILDALNKGCRRFIIGIGGSATNDGGAGMLEALGVRLKNEKLRDLSTKGGGSLLDLDSIDFTGMDKRLLDSQFQIACDVNNPLLGENGATYVYGPQKGASKEDLPRLEAGLEKWGELLENVIGRKIINVPGSGAAGGLGAGFLALPHAELKSGFDIISDTILLEEQIKKADLIITGEGKVDGQTIFGKVVSGVGLLAKKHRKPVICLAGTIEAGSESLLDHGITALFSIVNRPMTLDEAIRETPALLRDVGRNVLRLACATNTFYPTNQG